MIGFLRHNLKLANEKTKANSYAMLIRPHEKIVVPSGAHPHTADQAKKHGAIQRREARYMTSSYHNTSSLTDMLDHLQRETLVLRRTKCQLTMFYKVTNSLVNIHPELYLSKTSARTRANHSLKYHQISARKDYFKFQVQLFPRTIPVWNSYQ